MTQVTAQRSNARGRALNSFLKGVLDERAIDLMFQMAQILKYQTAALFPEEKDGKNNGGDKRKGPLRKISSRSGSFTTPKGVHRPKEKAKHVFLPSVFFRRESPSDEGRKARQEAPLQQGPPLRFKPRSRDSLHITLFFGGEVLSALPRRDLVAWHSKLVELLRPSLDSKRAAVRDSKSGPRRSTSGGDQDRYTLQFRRLETFPPHRRNLIVATFDASSALRRLHKDLRDIALESDSDQLRSVVGQSNENLTFHVTIGSLVGGSEEAVGQLEHVLKTGLGRRGSRRFYSVPSDNIEVELADYVSSTKLCEEDLTFEAKVLGLKMGGLVPPQAQLDWNFSFETRATADMLAQPALGPLQAQPETEPLSCKWKDYGEEHAPKVAGKVRSNSSLEARTKNK